MLSDDASLSDPEKEAVSEAINYLLADVATISCSVAHVQLAAEGGVCVKCEGGCRFRFITPLSQVVASCSDRACAGSATVK